MHPPTVKYLIQLNTLVINKNLEGLSHDDSLLYPEAGGNNINWILGHLVKSRASMASLLGQDPRLDQDELTRYARGSKPLTVADDALPLETLMGHFNRLQDVIEDGLDEIDDDTLGQPAPHSPTGNPEETIGSLLAGLAFHESYHAGQTGVLRNLSGKPGGIK